MGLQNSIGDTEDFFYWQEAALGLKHFPSGEPAIYLISAQRSYIDGMTGAKGAIIRKIAEGRRPAKLAENLDLAKQQLEGR